MSAFTARATGIAQILSRDSGLPYAEPPYFGRCRNGLYHISISEWFAESIVYSYSGGVNELDIGIACTSEDAGTGLKRKIDAVLEKADGRDITLWLLPDEAMCLAIASQNCRIENLTLPQLHKIQSWFDRWIELNRIADEVDS